MTDQLPVISWRDMMKFLNSQGFYVESINGTHIKLKSVDGKKQAYALTASRDKLNKYTIMQILKTADISKEELIRWYYRK